MLIPIPASATLVAPGKASALGLAIKKKRVARIRERPGTTVAASTKHAALPRSWS
jgi:hypothetical protein